MVKIPFQNSLCINVVKSVLFFPQNFTLDDSAVTFVSIEDLARSAASILA